MGAGTEQVLSTYQPAASSPSDQRLVLSVQDERQLVGSNCSLMTHTLHVAIIHSSTPLRAEQKQIIII